MLSDAASRQQAVAAEFKTLYKHMLEFLNQPVRANGVIHRIPNAAALSKPADLKHIVKSQLIPSASVGLQFGHTVWHCDGFDVCFVLALVAGGSCSLSAHQTPESVSAGGTTHQLSLSIDCM